jgi:hypothetical protein
MIIKLIFAVLCGILYCIGLPFGFNYEETSVYICIYLWPLLCVVAALYVTIKATIRKDVWIASINGFTLLVYSLITITIFKHYLALPSIHAQFNDCMWKLYGLSSNLGISYEALNLLIYVVLFSVIMLFHSICLIIMKKKKSSTRTKQIIAVA